MSMSWQFNLQLVSRDVTHIDELPITGSPNDDGETSTLSLSMAVGEISYDNFVFS